LYTQAVQKPSAREWDWLSAFLLFLLIQVCAARLVTTNWAPFLYYSETLAGFGTILGLALGASRFGRRAVIVLAGGYTTFLLPWQAAGAVTDELLLDRLRHVGDILRVSLDQFIQRQPVEDPLFFVAFVCLAFWIISLLAGYWLARRGTVLASIILSGTVLSMVQVYADYQPHGSWWLALYLFIALLLVGRVHFLRSKKDWSHRRVFVNEEAWPSIFGSLFMGVAIAVLLAWIVPSSPAGVRSAVDAWNAFSGPIRDRLSDAVSALNGPNGRPGTNFYDSTLVVGQDAASGDSTVFTVDVLSGLDSTRRFYWRGRVYDNYTAGRWSTSPASRLIFQPERGDLKITDGGDRSQAVLRFTDQFPTQGLIYAPSQPVWVDRPANLAAEQPDPGLYDTLSWEALIAVSMGGRYEVKSELSNPTIEQLRAVGITYPQWVNERYLGIPEALRVDLRSVAEKVAASQDNEYDTVVAITDYLRANLQYASSIPSPPEGQDPVAWVLFDYKKGFCTYYASAEVLLLRSIGIPARLAVGFAQGEDQNGVYTVRRRDAHAWPEVYFPGIGWLEFEPTASQAPLSRPSVPAQAGGIPANPGRPRPLEEAQGPDSEKGGSSTRAGPLAFASSGLGRALEIAGGLLLVSLLIYAGHRHLVWARVPLVVSKILQQAGMAAPRWIDDWNQWNRLEPLERAFAGINWSLRWLGKPQPMDATPAERARVLTRALPSASEHIAALKSEFETGLFTPRAADLARARRASFLIVMHAVRARLRNFVGASNGRDVYSK
jgi:transglutaminase-like putative cysteine protease